MRLLLVLLGFCLLLGAWTAIWVRAAARLRGEGEAWAARQRAAGWQVSAGAPHVSGWPFSVGVTWPGLHVAAGPGRLPVALAWDAERLTVRFAVWTPRRVVLTTGGVRVLHVAGLPGLRLSGPGLTATADLDAPGPLQVEGQGVQAAVEGGEPATIGALHASYDPAGRVHITADSIALPRNTAPVLGPEIARVSLDGAGQGTWPMRGSPEERLAGWRASGGALVLRRLAGTWGPAHAEASATLALDDSLQPAGAATVKVIGWAQATEAMGQSGIIDPRTAGVARALLGLLARPEAPAAPITLPLTLRDGVLSIGRIPVMRLPDVNWRSG